MPARTRSLPWLLLLFLGSGCAALIYEVVWLQLLQLVIGLTSLSLGLLLGIFMGGLCLGSWLLPRLLGPNRHPLRVYACLELGIALIGIAVPVTIPWLADAYTAQAGPGASGALWRGLLGALCLLPPTLLMGATLPAIARWVESTRDGIAWLGFFYGGNLAGAVIGCLLAGFYLLRVHDMRTATLVAAGLNVLVALVALALAGKSAAAEKPRSPATRSDDHETRANALASPLPPVAPVWPVHVVIALSGVTALGAEVVWTRLLSLLMGGTVYTFSIILAVFLVGLGLGSTAGSALSRTVRRPRLALALCQALLIAGIGWAAGMMSSSLPHWPINPALTTSPWYTFQLDLARGLWAVLPAAFLWGASFPLALASAVRPNQDSGRLVGGIYAANTVGAITGALLFSLVIVPIGGTQFAQRLLVGLAAGSTLLALAGARIGHAAEPAVRGSRAALATWGAVATALAIITITFIEPIPWGLAAYGRFLPTYTNRLAPGIVTEEEAVKRSDSADIFCTYLGEGMNGTIAVTKWASGVRNFHSAGKVQASNDPRDMRLQRMLGHLSALAHGNPESVLVVACGAGVTAGAFVPHPETRRIVVCDIEPLVPREVAPRFARENFGVITDPRTQVISDDGRHFIRTTREKFDVITSDPIDPWFKGCAALNTVEYYKMCKAHLKPGGVMSLWIPLYESNAITVKSAIATFFQVFPHGILWSNDDAGEGYDAVLFGQAEPSRLDLDVLQTRLDRPDYARVKQSLADVGFHSVVDLLATYAGRATELKSWMADAQINTDANLRLQYLAGWSANSFVSADILDGIRKYRTFPEDLFPGSPAQRERLKTRLQATTSR